MPYWVYGAGFTLLVIVIAALKAEYQTRVWLAIALVGALAFMALRKKR